MANAPFKVGGIVEPPYFVGREKELETLVRDARTLAQSVLILAPRRYGKSSLLYNLKKQLDAEQHLLVPYVNCRDLTCHEDFYRATVAAVLSEFERKRRVRGLLEAFRYAVKEKVLSALRRIEEIGGSVGDVGKAYLRFRESEVDKLELVRAAFRFFRAFSEEKGMQILFLMDEFQEVATFDGALFNLLKKELDENTDTRYVFSGSSVRMLTSIFLSEEAPLYLMVGRHRMEPLEEADVSTFVSHRLAVAGLQVASDAAIKFHTLTGGIPFYVQKLGLLATQEAHFRGVATIDGPVVHDAFTKMLEELDGEFETRWIGRFSPLQRQIVKALAKLGEAGVTEIATQLGVERTDISSSLRRLRDMMVISKNNRGTYSLVDVVFSAWLRQT
jgi:AAA+ ATPase superfamily predicted ATPase